MRKDLTAAKYVVPAGNDHKHRSLIWIPTGIVSVWGGSAIAALIDFGTAIPFASTTAILGASIVFGLGRIRGKNHAAAVNGALEEAFHTDVRVTPDSAREVVNGNSVKLNDGENGYYELVFSAEKQGPINGEFVISHVPGSMGLTEFDSMLTAMSGNADVKAIMAKLQDDSVSSPVSRFTALLRDDKDAA